MVTSSIVILSILCDIHVTMLVVGWVSSVCSSFRPSPLQHIMFLHVVCLLKVTTFTCLSPTSCIRIGWIDISRCAFKPCPWTSQCRSLPLPFPVWILLHGFGNLICICNSLQITHIEYHFYVTSTPKCTYLNSTAKAREWRKELHFPPSSLVRLVSSLCV